MKQGIAQLPSSTSSSSAKSAHLADKASQQQSRAELGSFGNDADADADFQAEFGDQGEGGVFDDDAVAFGDARRYSRLLNNNTVACVLAQTG